MPAVRSIIGIEITTVFAYPPSKGLKTRTQHIAPTFGFLTVFSYVQNISQAIDFDNKYILAFFLPAGIPQGQMQDSPRYQGSERTTVSPPLTLPI
jgi:hypothetical protein